MNRYDATEIPPGTPPRWTYEPRDLCPSHAYAGTTGRAYFCTGPRGHSGDHYADTFRRCVATWPASPARLSESSTTAIPS